MGEYLHNFKGIMKAAELYHEIRWNVKNCMVDSKSEYFPRFTHIDQHERVKRFTP